MWKNININKTNIKYETGSATLIAFPHSSDLDGYMFWHPSKLIRQGRNKGAVSISYTEEFDFKIFKNGKGKTNKFTKVAEDVIDANEFEMAFGIVNECIVSPNFDFETHKPKQLEVKEVEALEELKDE